MKPTVLWDEVGLQLSYRPEAQWPYRISAGGGGALLRADELRALRDAIDKHLKEVER